MSSCPKKAPATKRRGRHPDKAFSAAFCRGVAEAGRYCDGNGLYLEVDPTGARRWVQRLVIRGRCTLGLGGFALVSLAEAREAALANRKLARPGGDPLAARRRARAMPTLEEAAALEQKRGSWRNEKHAQDWPASLRLYVFPRLGDKPVSEITSADLLPVLAPIWHEKPETARRVRQRIGAVRKSARMRSSSSSGARSCSVTTTVSIRPSPRTGVALSWVATAGPSGTESTISSARTRSALRSTVARGKRAQRKLAAVGAPAADHLEEVLGRAAGLAQALDDTPSFAVERDQARRRRVEHHHADRGGVDQRLEPRHARGARRGRPGRWRQRPRPARRTERAAPRRPP